MKPIDCLTLVKDTIDSVPLESALQPSMPIRAFLGITEICIERAERNKEALAKAKFDIKKLDDLRTLAGALRETHSAWSDVQFDSPETSLLWKAKQAEGEEVRFELVEAFLLAFHDDETIMAKIAAINEGASNADQIQDINELVYTARNNIDVLERETEITRAFLDKASELAGELGAIYAKAVVDRSELPETRITRDRNYTLMYNIIKDIERRGQYAFRNDDRKAAQFSFSYKPVARKKKAAPVVAEPVK